MRDDRDEFFLSIDEVIIFDRLLINSAVEIDREVLEE
jgi:hypothetical protein